MDYIIHLATMPNQELIFSISSTINFPLLEYIKIPSVIFSLSENPSPSVKK